MTDPAAVPDIRTAVDAALGDFLAARRRELEPLGPDLVPLLDAAGTFVADGKRLRPQFCIAGWEAAGGGAVPDAVVTVAAALEWLQASALVHDDLIDESDTRRGRPSIHRAFEPIGTAAAVLLGDLMLTWCDQMVRSADWSTIPGTLDAALNVLDTCKNEVVSGQFLDVVAQTKTAVSVAEAMRVVTYKSAKYTVERPLHLGAVLAGADGPLLDQLTAVALPLGRAFQLRDDVLGVFGDPAVTGKPAGDDLREGKRTVLVARTAERTDDAGRTRLGQLLGTVDGVSELRGLIVDTGALSAVESDIDSEVAAAQAAIDALGRGATLQSLLAQATQRHR